MIFDPDSTLVSRHSAGRIRGAINDMVHNDLSTKEIYLKYRLYERNKNYTATTIYNRHVINWLYTIRTQVGRGGLKYIENVLQQLRYTLKRNLDEQQFEYIRLLFDCFINQRNLYK